MWTKSLRPYYLMGILIVGSLALAAGMGLLRPAIYEGYLSEGLIAFQFLQDALTLLLAIALIPLMYLTARGSLRAFVVWGGILVFVPYYYAFFAFGLLYNALYPVYLALVGLGTFSLIGLLIGVDLPAFAQRAKNNMPVHLIAVVLAMPLLLVPLWVAMMLQGIRTQQVQETALVIVMDLCFLIPACAYSAAQIWRRRPVGYLLAGPLLCKAVLSGVLLGAGELQKQLSGQPMALEQFAMWVFLTFAGSIALGFYLRNLHGERARQT
jgi:hypothetical protein